MRNFGRRDFIRGSAAAGVASLTSCWPANAAAPKTRYSAFSVEGRKSIASYAKAVALMRERSRIDPTDPIGWTYQYKMHWFPDFGDTVVLPDGAVDWAGLQRYQVAELDTFFGPATLANTKRREADATWGKCPHTRGTVALNFMPWHRMYLFFFERIVRKASGDDNFTLPYWGYTDGKTSQVLPPGFDEIGSPLFHNRSSASNQGDPMPSIFFRTDFWNDPDFLNFSRAVENAPHGGVHAFVGFRDHDMQSLFQSPRDPVFWLHHCEIDRIWEGALKAGFKPPSDAWLDNKSQFFDEERTPVELTNRDVLNIEQIGHWPGYSYHDAPRPPAAASVAEATSSRPRRTLATGPSIAVRAGVQNTVLVATPAMATLNTAPLAAAGARRIKLEISEVSIDKRAVANIALYLNAPPDAQGEALRQYEIGILSTFSILPGSDMAHARHGPAGPPDVLSFDITRLVTELQREQRWTSEPRLTTAEITGSLGSAVLRLGKVELVETSISGPLQ